MASGEVVLPQVDVRLPGILPLVLERTHLSSYRAGRLFGASWASTLDQRLEVGASGVCFATADGMLLDYPRPVPESRVWPEYGPRWPLSPAGDGGYTVTDPRTGREWHFPRPGPDGVSPIIAITDRNGNRIDFDRDDAGTLRGIRHSGGYAIVAEVGEGRLRALRPRTGTTRGVADEAPLIAFGYDEAGRLTEVIDSSGRPLRFSYDAEGRLTEWVDRNDCWYRYTYDEYGRGVRGEGSDGYLNVALSYDPVGRTTTVTDSCGNATVYHLNETGQVVAETDPHGHVTRTEWDRHDRLLSRTDPLGRTTRYRYDEVGDLIELVRPDGARVSAVYESPGPPAEVTEADGTVWRYSYDERGNLAAAADGARVEFAYDSELRLTAVTDPRGLVWRYRYDALGNLVGETDFDGRELRYAHDAAGRLIERVNGMGQVTRYTRDPLDNVIERRGGEGGAVFTYDRAGRLVRAVNGDADVRFDRDPLGRVTAETVNGRTLTSAYDPMGRRVSRRTPSGATAAWEYDAAGRPVLLRTSGRVLRFGYDAAGREVERRIDDGAILIQQWDADHRLTAQTLWGAPRPRPIAPAAPSRSARPHGPAAPGEPRLLQHRTYAYRRGRGVTAIGDRLSGARRLDLDPTGRVTAVHAQGWSERYAYDEAGNLTSGGWPNSDDPAVGRREYVGTLIRRAGRTHYEHDAQGRVIVRRRRTLSGRVQVWRREPRTAASTARRTSGMRRRRSSTHNCIRTPTAWDSAWTRPPTGCNVTSRPATSKSGRGSPRTTWSM